ncbi:MAG: bacteriohemerythrin [Candidatus Thiodiazotropha sp.]
MPQIENFQAIEWDESMATGIAAIDKQHHYLVETLQDMNKRLLDDDSDLLLSQVVKDLLGYALMHFETEEALMQRYDYAAACPDDAQAHIAQHRDFSRQVVTIRDQLREGQKVSRIEILRFLNHWLRDHVLGVDQSLGKFLLEKMD